MRFTRLEAEAQLNAKSRGAYATGTGEIVEVLNIASMGPAAEAPEGSATIIISPLSILAPTYLALQLSSDVRRLGDEKAMTAAR